MTRNLLWFGEAGCADVAVAGGKGASLAAMTGAGLKVPRGFALRADVLERCVDADRLRSLARDGDHEAAQALVRQASPPDREIAAAYIELGGGAVAVRSSACSEDSETASFAGQQETYLNVSGVDDVCRCVVECWASFFSERALFYRSRMGFLDDLGIAVLVQQMVEPVKSGVVFTVDPVNGRRDRMIVEAVRGLGEQVVSGHVTPDHYVVDREGGVKQQRLANGGVLESEELRALALLACRLEEQFGSPQDVEWAIRDGEIFLLQSRPVTTL
jgi:pyruvate, water dikinase